LHEIAVADDAGAQGFNKGSHLVCS
jgi:hypothetical protein